MAAAPIARPRVKKAGCVAMDSSSSMRGPDAPRPGGSPLLFDLVLDGDKGPNGSSVTGFWRVKAVGNPRKSVGQLAAGDSHFGWAQGIHDHALAALGRLEVQVDTLGRAGLALGIAQELHAGSGEILGAREQHDSDLAG